MTNVINSRNFNPSPNDSYFFDNNIWMYLFCPLGNYNQHCQNSSSQILNSIIQSGAKIYTNALILSEFANSYLRMEYNIWKSNITNGNTDFKKDFKLTPNYSATQTLIEDSVNRILKLSQYCNDKIDILNSNSFSSNFQVIDFNDSYILSLCVSENFKLVSNDRDFIGLNSQIDLIKL